MSALHKNGDYLSFGNRNHSLKTLPEWIQHNQKVLKGDVIGITNKNTSTTKNCIIKVNNTSCNDFDDSTDQLKHRVRHINYWKEELNRAVQDLEGEINVLEVQRQQLKNAMDTLKIPEYITEECLDIRTNRMQSDLVYDEPQQELFKESALIENVKRMYNQMLREMESQLKMNLAVKDILIRDWSLKSMAFKYENENVNLVTQSENIKESPGATKLADGQSDINSWEKFTVENLVQFKNAIDKSKDLRSKVEGTLINIARDLRCQDVAVNKAISERLARTEQVKKDLENQLQLTLDKIVETENVLQTLHEEILKVKQRIQVAQSRLHIKSSRPYVENCREGSLIGLIDEVKDLNDSLSLLQTRSLETERNRAQLVHERSLIENEIIVKKKTLYLDNGRCLYIRSHFQSAEKLCGY